MRGRFVRARGEDGAALVLALIIVTVVALGLSALLSLSDTSIRTTVGLRDQVSTTYSADGAMQAAVNNLRNSTYNHAAGQHCFGTTDTLQLSGFYGSDSAAVTCESDPKRILIHCPTLSDCNRPGNAILTLGTNPAEDGVNITQPIGSTFRVHGNVFSNSNINVVKGALNTNAAVWARSSCSGTIQSVPAPSCNYGDSNELGDDPNYVADATTAPVHRDLPTCNRPNSLVTFLPGTYDDANGLSTMMGNSSSCKNSTWWFTPGTYYFDFHNSGPAANPLLPSAGDNVWTIDNGTLVGGTPVDSAGGIIAKPPVPASIPGSCDNPINNVNFTTDGVQFIFGGDSRLTVKAGEAELCGSIKENKVPVAVYGLKSGTETTTTWTGDAKSLKLNAVTAGSKFTNATPTTLATNDATVATWNSTKKNDSTVLTLKGFAPVDPIPAGSRLQSAEVKIRHRHTDITAADSFDVSLMTGSGPALTGSTTGRIGNPSLQTDTISLDTARTGALATAIYKGNYSDATIDLTTKLQNDPKNDAELIDSVQLELTFIPPALRGANGCVTSGPYTGGGDSAANCSMITATNTSGNQFYVQGTTYAPKAALDITLNNAEEQVFRFGVISRALWVKETGSFSYTGVVIEVPDDSPGFVFSMYLTAYLCPGAGPCSTTGAPALRSKVALVDANPSTPQPGARQVTILSWSRPG
ncbi:hypothetical protein EV646_108134 [Kribbella antiqua]|uniref:Tfp pilus assembly protein PilX n=1 Tax=Kribbella antiqua TaxID=2512217 RepID=A0A4R2ILX4_9ACTN|nr:hypothetical protein [Kribbella antiqua]TCO45512.1 hypothetical protein EV646_108134 [Kribbella antiqua]